MSRAIGPLILAVGIIGSTVVAMLAEESRWWVLAGPLFMALSLMVAVFVHRRLHGPSRGTSGGAILLGAAIVLAGVILAQANPARVAPFMPILGATAFVVFLATRRNRASGKGDKSRGV